MAFSDLLGMADGHVRDISGGPVTYTPGVGSAVTVSGVFDAVYQRADVSEAGISTSGPAVWLILEDLPSNPATDSAARITVAGVTYRVWEAKPDGLGTILCALHQV